MSTDSDDANVDGTEDGIVAPEDVLGDLPECTIVPAGEIPTRE